MRRHILVAYDICDARRLRRVHAIVRDYGDPVQYSIFSCQLTELQRAELERELLEVIDQGCDQVLLVDLGQAAADDRAVPGSRVLGRPRQPALVGVVVL